MAWRRRRRRRRNYSGGRRAVNFGRIKNMGIKMIFPMLVGVGAYLYAAVYLKSNENTVLQYIHEKSMYLPLVGIVPGIPAGVMWGIWGYAVPALIVQTGSVVEKIYPTEGK